MVRNVWELGESGVGGWSALPGGGCSGSTGLGSIVLNDLGFLGTNRRGIGHFAFPVMIGNIPRASLYGIDEADFERLGYQCKGTTLGL